MITLTLVHPGEILLEEFMKPENISQKELSDGIDVPKSRINQIVLKQRRITADTACKLAGYFETSPEFWMHLQANYDLDLYLNNGTIES